MKQFFLMWDSGKLEWNIEPSGTWNIEDKEHSCTGLGQRVTGQVGQKGGGVI